MKLTIQGLLLCVGPLALARARTVLDGPPDCDATLPCRDEGVEVAVEAATSSQPSASASPCGCQVSKVVVRQDHAGGSTGISLADVTAIYGGGHFLTEAQRKMVTLAEVATTSFSCLDDRVQTPSLSTPGADLGEYILALASYLTERDPTGTSRPTQEVVDSLFQRYVESMPPGRPLVHCTDDRAVQHLESELPVENLDLSNPPDHVKSSGLLQKLTEVDNHGDSHIRLMLKQPEWFQLDDQLVPMVLKSFYSHLWQENSAGSSRSPRLRLDVLVGTSDPQAFLEVSSGDLCQNRGVAPMITPKFGGRSVLVSHLDAVSKRREELAAFFAHVAAATPRKIDKERLHQRLDRHGWLALETTGSRVAAGLPFYSLTYM